jgi:hypothetical protein
MLTTFERSAGVILFAMSSMPEPILMNTGAAPARENTYCRFGIPQPRIDAGQVSAASHEYTR